MSGRDILIEITSQGSCMGVYSDNSGMEALGDLQVTRLSDVEYDNAEHGWVVRFRNGIVLANVYPERIRALAAEMSYVEANLDEFSEWVQANHPEAVHIVVDASMS